MNECTSWRELLRRSDWRGRLQDYSGALALAREALDWSKREFGDESYEVADTWEYIAKAASYSHDAATVTAAQQAVKRLLDALKAGTSPGSSTEASGLIYEANRLFMMMGDEKTVIPMVEKACDRYRKVLGPGHATVGYALARIGQLYNLTGQPQAGLPFFEKALEILENRIGPCHVDVASILEEMSGALQTAGNLQLPPTAPNPVTDPAQYSAEIRALFEKSATALARAKSIREGCGEKDASMYYLLLSEAQVLQYLGRAAEAEPLEKRARAILPEDY